MTKRTRRGESLHERWRREYRSDRYCQHLNRPELNKRIRDIFLNQLLVNHDAKISLANMDADGGELMQKWTHVLEEMVLRYGPYPNGFERDILHSEPFPDFASELAAKAAAAMSKLDVSPGKFFIKLGSEANMRRLHVEGQLRLQPASFYSRPEHIGAVRDDEMSVPVSFSLDREQIRRFVINPEDVPDDQPSQRMDVEFSTNADFWLYCVTQTAEARLFVDFNAHACVLIKDRAEFTRRLREATRGQLMGAEMREANAVYVDPLLPKSPKIFIPYSKPFGYQYQKEYRFCWMPEPMQTKLEYKDFVLGSLEDISELIVL